MLPAAGRSAGTLIESRLLRTSGVELTHKVCGVCSIRSVENGWDHSPCICLASSLLRGLGNRPAEKVATRNAVASCWQLPLTDTVICQQEHRNEACPWSLRHGHDNPVHNAVHDACSTARSHVCARAQCIPTRRSPAGAPARLRSIEGLGLYGSGFRSQPSPDGRVRLPGTAAPHGPCLQRTQHASWHASARAVQRTGRQRMVQMAAASLRPQSRPHLGRAGQRGMHGSAAGCCTPMRGRAWDLGVQGLGFRVFRV